MISQELFDETLLENEELFELCPEDALQETIEQFEKSNQSVRHLSLTHPHSESGKIDRLEAQVFSQDFALLKQCIQADGSVKIMPGAFEALVHLERFCTSKSNLAMLHRQGGITIFFSLLNVAREQDDIHNQQKSELLMRTLRCLVLILNNSTSSQRDDASRFLPENLLQLKLSMNEDLLIQTLKLLQACCKCNERNKRSWTASRESIRRLVTVLRETENQELAISWCSFVYVLCRFDDFRESSATAHAETSVEPIVASSHETVLELSRCGLVFVLKEWIYKAGHNETLLSGLLTTLRVMAVHDDIVQSMVAVGLLDIAIDIVVDGETEELLTASIGMLRNVSANDEIKSTLCQNAQLLMAITRIAEKYPESALLQEHICGLLAAMALRKPKNATRILQYNGAFVILTAMNRHPSNPVLQRQGALAIRNLASRATPEEKQSILETLNAETILRLSGRFSGNVDESYAALRDLGCKVSKTTYHDDGTVSTQPRMFGTVESNFRAVYD